MDIKMIVCDLDGTLLNSDKDVSARTVEVLERCCAKGLVIAIATARSECASQRAIVPVRPDVTITSGGAVVKHKGEVLHEALISLDITNALLARLMSESDVKFISVPTAEGFLVDHPVNPAETGWRDYLHAKHVDFTQIKHLQAEKIVPFLPRELAISIAAEFDDVVLTLFTGEEWVQFACKTATKFNGIVAVAKQLGIDMVQIAAFGDDLNDLEMLEKCGFGVAMDNAIPEVKAVADFVTASNNDDGVALWLEENVL